MKSFHLGNKLENGQKMIKKATHQPETHEGHFGALIRYVRFSRAPLAILRSGSRLQNKYISNKSENLIISGCPTLDVTVPLA